MLRCFLVFILANVMFLSASVADMFLETVTLKPSVRISGLESLDQVYDLNSYKPAMQRYVVLNGYEVESAPVITAFEEDRVLNEANYKIFVSGGDFDESKVIYSIVQEVPVVENSAVSKDLMPKAPLKKCHSGKGIVDNKIYQICGTAVVDYFGEVSRMTVKSINYPIQAGMKVVPQPNVVIPWEIKPNLGKPVITADIYWLESMQNMVGDGNLVAINMGLNEGIEVGDLFSIYQPVPSAFARVGMLSDSFQMHIEEEEKQNLNYAGRYIPAGKLIVYQSFMDMSMGVIVSSKLPVGYGYKVQNNN